MEDKGNLAINQTGLLTDVAINCLYGGLRDHGPANRSSPRWRDSRLRKVILSFFRNDMTLHDMIMTVIVILTFSE